MNKLRFNHVRRSLNQTKCQVTWATLYLPISLWFRESCILFLLLHFRVTLFLCSISRWSGIGITSDKNPCVVRFSKTAHYFFFFLQNLGKTYMLNVEEKCVRSLSLILSTWDPILLCRLPLTTSKGRRHEGIKIHAAFTRKWHLWLMTFVILQRTAIFLRTIAKKWIASSKAEIEQRSRRTQQFMWGISME